MSSTPNPSRRNFIKIGAGVVGGAVVASAVAVPLYLNQTCQDTSTISSLQGQVAAANQQLSTATQQVSTLQGEVETLQTRVGNLSQLTAFKFFNAQEQVLVAALAETLIPTDANGPGAKEAGAIYFVDAQLAGPYGNNENMYNSGPFVQPNQTAPVTVGGITYEGGSAPAAMTAGGGYQYPLSFQQFWRICLAATQTYCNSAYGGNFETLTSAQQTQVLQDLWNNKPTTFNGIQPQAFFSELHDMVFAGFLTDPQYGGNRGMVGWSLIGFTGTNQGNAYGEGYTPQQLMVMSSPVRLKPASLAQYQESQGELPQGGA